MLQIVLVVMAAMVAMAMVVMGYILSSLDIAYLPKVHGDKNFQKVPLGCGLQAVGDVPLKRIVEAPSLRFHSIRLAFLEVFLLLVVAVLGMFV